MQTVKGITIRGKINQMFILILLFNGRTVIVLNMLKYIEVLMMIE